MDGKIYHCLNRTDEDPFSKQKNTTIDDRWLELVNSTCYDGDDPYLGYQRRCLGDKPIQCVGE